MIVLWGEGGLASKLGGGGEKTGSRARGKEGGSRQKFCPHYRERQKRQKKRSEHRFGGWNPIYPCGRRGAGALASGKHRRAKQTVRG